MEPTTNAALTDQLLFIASVLALESRQLISARGINQTFGFAEFTDAASVNAGPLRVIFDALEGCGWLSQASDDQYFFKGPASAIALLPSQASQLFSWLAPELPQAAELSPAGPWLELAALDWNLHCPVLRQGLDQLLALGLLQRLQRNAGIDVDSGRVDPGRLAAGPMDPDARRRLSDFLRGQRWIRREERHLVLAPERRTLLAELLSQPFLAYFASLPAMVEELLFGQEERWAQALQWLQQAGEQYAWPGDRPTLELLLGQLFDAQPVSAQAQWVVSLGRSPAGTLDQLEHWVGRHTARGRALEHHPLRWLELDRALAGEPQAARQQLQEAGVPGDARILWLGIGQQNLLPPQASTPRPPSLVPRRHYLDFAGQAVDGAAVLASLERSAAGLAMLTGEQLLVLSDSHWYPGDHWAGNLACHYPVEAAHYLMALAGAGLFAEPGMLHKFPQDGLGCSATSGCYKRREYRVRHAAPGDMGALLELEQACWPAGGRVDEAILRRRLRQDPAGQLVLELGGQVVGVIYSQRLLRIEDLATVNFATVDQLFHGKGRIVQIQSLNILPAHQYSGYGDQLLELMLQYCTLQNGVDTVVGVTRCKDYPRHRHLALADYIQARDERGGLLDPILRFHEQHGARIEKLVAGYRPADADNAGHGVLVHYHLAGRQCQQPQPVAPRLEQPGITPEVAVRQALNRCLGQAPERPVSAQHSLMELGLDSADLPGLGEALGRAFGLVLEPSFFFRYNNLGKILDAVQERLGGPASPGAEAQAAYLAPASQPPALSATPGDDFAVVGISGSFPGGGLEGFYAAIHNGTSQLREVPPERGMAGPVAGYIDGIEYFDPGFFSLSAAEAALMDPQQRLLLQHAWLALDDAAISAADFARQPTGVFITAAPSQYPEVVEVPCSSPYLLTSSAPCMYANRISWFLDLRGPSEYCNTACSSALVAVHRAMQAMRSGECRQALVGAVNLLLSADETAGYRQMGLLSEQAQTRSFQAGADGYVRAEGVGVLLLKPLADALRDGDRIHLKIKGSGVSHGGHGMSLTAPDHDGMQAAMVAAYRRAGVTPQTLGYVEAHGTGSALGDAIEIDALQAAYRELGDGQAVVAPWHLSSLKPLIGHCELASGMAALFKVIDALRQRRLPGIPGYGQPNPAISLDPQLLSLSAQNRPWPAMRDARGQELPRRASINSYGFGGVNAHLVVEEPDVQPRPPGLAHGPQLILLSAQDGQRLREQAALLGEAIERQPELDLADIAYTLQVGRTAMACRWASQVQSISVLRHQLDALARGLGDSPVWVEEVPPGNHGSLDQALATADLGALAAAWLQGRSVPWQQLQRPQPPRRVGLPGYAFARQRHWLPPRLAATTRPAAPCPQPGRDLRQILAQVLGCDPQALAGCEARSLASLGLDSLGAVGLKARLEQRLQVAVPLAQLSPYLSLGEVEAYLATLDHDGEQGLLPVLQAEPEAACQPFALNDIQQSFLSGRMLLAETERVGCHIYLEFDWPELDVYRLEQAWNRLLAQHDALRLKMLDDGRQQAGPALPYRFKVRDLRRSDSAERERSLIALRASMSHQLYQVGQEHLFTIAVSLLDQGTSRVHLSIDELIVDATSLEVLLQQWLQVYREPAAVLPGQDLRFRDYQLALDAFKASPRYQRDLRYWVDKLAQLPAGLYLPKAPGPAGRHRRRLVRTLDRERWRRLKEQGAALQVSGSALLLGLFGLVLQQANAGQGFSLICTCYGRLPLHPDIDSLVGPLISTQLFSFAAAQGQDLAQWLQQAQRQLLEDLDHGCVGSVAALREARRTEGQGPRFSGAEVVFTSMLNNPAIDGAPGFADAQRYCVTQTPQINLDHQLRERAGVLEFSWDVAIDCYPEGMLEKLFEDYCQLLARVADTDAGWKALPVSELVVVAPFQVLPVAASGRPFALTDQQQAYAFNRTLHPGQGNAQLYCALAIDDLDVARLGRAWQQLVAHHPMLRTRVLANGTQQVMEPAPSAQLELEPHGPGGDARRIAERLLGEVTALGDWPHAWLRVSPLDGGCQGVHLAVDLLLIDLPSRNLLLRQLLQLYHGQPLAPLNIDFAGYVAALEGYKRTPAAGPALAYWQEKFRHLPCGPQLDDGGAGSVAYLEYEHCLACWPALRTRIHRAGISADALLIAVYARSIARHGWPAPFTLVAPGWQRPAAHPQVDALVGDFTTLSWIDFHDRPATLLEEARRCERIFAEDRRHACVSGLQALRKMATNRQSARKLEFPVVFTRLDPQGPLGLPEGATLVKSASRTHGVALDNLSSELPQGLLIHWDLAPGRLDPARVTAMFADYCRLLERLAGDDQAWYEPG
ncbi:GNAT family N-acetyltransferase [Pseudomonas piscis]|uniref:GNAT family N-acetyltransferase n=1 Tax=Pseudomonas piscis TaxID=2614538 RepID=UPI00384AC9BA